MTDRVDVPSHAHRMRAIMRLFSGLPRPTMLTAAEIAAGAGYADQKAQLAGAGSLMRLVKYGELLRMPGRPARWYRP